MKAILKLALVALVANATWHLWGAYSAHFKFKDAVQSMTQFSSDKSEQDVRERLPFQHGTFDVVMLMQVLSGAPSWHRILDEARRVLRPKGTIAAGRVVMPRGGVDDQMKTLPEALRPQLWYISDPGDYHRPLVFDPSSPAWN